MAYVKNGPMAIAGMVADMSNYTIYTIGDIDFVYTAFNGIALIFPLMVPMNGSGLLHMQLNSSINQ